MSDTATEATETEATTTTEATTAETLPDDQTLAEQKKAIRELKAKAQRLDEIEQAQKSEAEKAADRIRALEEDAAEARREALRFKVASKFGITDEDADLFLTGSDEETLVKQAERLGAREADRKKNGNHVPREGNNPTSTGDQGDLAFAKALFSQE